MNVPSQIDVLVAGAGMAGASAAAALAGIGYHVLVVEPGMDASKRLAGELIHPPGAQALEELGLLHSLQSAGGDPVLGFAVAFRPDQIFVLPYGEVPGLPQRGLAMEHAEIRGRLLDGLGKITGVTTCMGGRITAVDLSEPGWAKTTVSVDGCEFPVRSRLLVAADGGSSHIARLAGIAHRRTRVSNMVGFLLQDCQLPHTWYGHVFLGSPAPILAYSVGPGQVRVMFDVPDNPDGIGALATDPSYLQALPEDLRQRVRAEMDRDKGLVSANYVVIPNETVRGRLVLVGDAGGCCHPLTATGLSVSSRDALRLREALKECDGDIDRALHFYELSRRGPQRVRLTLATALYEVFASRSPQMVLLRNGLVRYWSGDPAGRAASMALLSTWENRMSIMAQEYARVLLYGLTTGFTPGNGDSPVVELGKRGRAAVDLSWQFLKTVNRSLRIR